MFPPAQTGDNKLPHVILYLMVCTHHSRARQVHGQSSARCITKRSVRGLVNKHARLNVLYHPCIDTSTECDGTLLSLIGLSGLGRVCGCVLLMAGTNAWRVSGELGHVCVCVCVCVCVGEGDEQSEVFFCCEAIVTML